MKTNVWMRIFLTVLVILLSFTLIAARLFQVAEPLFGLSEQLGNLLLLVLFPVIIQVYKVWRDRGGKIPSKLFLQVASGAIALVFVYYNGGFVGLVFPAIPVWSGDIVAFIGALYVFGKAVVAVAGLAWGAMMVVYEGVLKRLFEIIGFAAKAKVASRKTVGFWA